MFLKYFYQKIILIPLPFYSEGFFSITNDEVPKEPASTVAVAENEMLISQELIVPLPRMIKQRMNDI